MIALHGEPRGVTCRARRQMIELQAESAAARDKWVEALRHVIELSDLRAHAVAEVRGEEDEDGTDCRNTVRRVSLHNNRSRDRVRARSIAALRLDDARSTRTGDIEESGLVWRDVRGGVEEGSKRARRRSKRGRREVEEDASPSPKTP